MFESVINPVPQNTHMIDALMYTFSGSEDSQTPHRPKQLTEELEAAFKAYELDDPLAQVPHRSRATYLTSLTVNGIRYSTMLITKGIVQYWYRRPMVQ